MLHARYTLTVLAALAVLLSACSPAAPPAATVTAAPPAEPTALPTATFTAEPSATPLPPSPTPAPTETTPPVAEATGTGELPPVISSGNAGLIRQVGEVDVANPAELDWSADGQIVGALNREGLVLYDAAELSQVSTALVQAPVVLLDFSADTRLMAVTSDQMTIILRNLESGSVESTIDVEGMFMAAGFSPNGQLLAVPTAEQIAVRIYDTATGQLRQTLAGFETAAPVYSARFSGDGEHIIWVSRGTLQVTTLATGESSPYFSHEDFVTAQALAPGGALLAAATDGMVDDAFAPFIQLWDVRSGQEAGRLLTGQDPTNALAFAPDGRTLASGTGSRVILWDVETREQVAVLGEHPDGVTSLAFSDDGRSLASAGSDGAVRIWQVER